MVGVATNGSSTALVSQDLLCRCERQTTRGMLNRHKLFQVADGNAETVRRKLGLR